MELGLAPMQALTGIYVVKGRPAMAADMMVALCVSRPSVCRYFRCVQTTDQVAEYETLRHGDPAPTRISFSMADAKHAGLGGGNWGAYPAVMLRHRAASQLARAVYPDLIMGLYEEDEARAIDMRETTPSVYAPVSAPPPPPPAAPEPTVDDVVALESAMLGARTLADLRAASDKVRAAKLTEEQTAHFRALYADCRRALEPKKQQTIVTAPVPGASDPCQTCAGTGAVERDGQPLADCPTCHGDGLARNGGAA
jgi:hypothetical protein